MTSFFVRCAALALVALSVTALANAQSTFEPVSLEDRLSDPIYLAWVSDEQVGECVSCHLEIPLGDLIGGKDEIFGTFSRRNEMERWLSDDKHSIARRRVEPFDIEQTEEELGELVDWVIEKRATAVARLRDAGRAVEPNQLNFKLASEQLLGKSNLLSRRICDKLWGVGAVKTDDGYRRFRDQCLTCHGGYELGEPGFNQGDVESAQLGIDCNHCHQLGKQSQWVTEHTQPKNWRLRTPESKQAAGMRDLVDTTAQASLCLNCHVGNREKEMFVTHEMYAAGHPPLPSIEVQQFCEQMPQHWQTPWQLHDSLENYAGRETYFQINYGALAERVPVENVFWNTRKMLLSSLAVERQFLELYLQSIDQNAWSDYALYDCAACHHELQSNSARRQRGFPAPPGRPRQHEWPSMLSDVAIQLGGRQTTSKIQTLQRQLTQAFGQQPFGDAAQVSSIARQLMDQLDQVIVVAKGQRIEDQAAVTVLKRLARTPPEKTVTYDSARQLIWAMQTVADELNERGVPISTEAIEMLHSLGDPKVTGIQTAIPAGRDKFIFPLELRADLERRADFDPRALGEKLIRLQEILDRDLP